MLRVGVGGPCLAHQCAGRRFPSGKAGLMEPVEWAGWLGLITGGNMTRLDSLTGLRFVAAFVVLLRHTVPEMFDVPVLSELAAIGPIGVGFFFVLSGFVLTWTWKPAQSKGRFYFNRAARIAPLHVLTTIIAVAMLAFAGNPHWFSSIMSLFLLQAWGTEAWRLGGNGPSWSLSVEAFFYLCFPFLIRPIARLSTRRLFWLIGAAFVAMIVWTALYGLASIKDVPFVTVFSTYTNPVYRLGEFVIGIALAVVVRNGWRVRVSLRSALVVAGVAYCGLAGVNGIIARSGISLGDSNGLPLGVLDLAYLPVTILVIAAAVTSDLAGKPSMVGSPALVRLGDWSFSLYLIQMIAVIPLASLAASWRNEWQGGVLLAATILGCIALSGAMYHWFERPVERALKLRFASRRGLPLMDRL